MNWIGELWRRLQFRSHRAHFDEDLTEEMRFHVELRAAEKRADGMEAADAEAAARRRFGNVTQLREDSREVWGWAFLDTMVQDVRYGLRSLAAHPGFTATAVLSLALGIGANTAIFTIVNAVMLRSLPVEDPKQLVQIKLGGYDSLTNPIWEQVRDHQQAFSGTLAFGSSGFDLSDGGESRMARGLWVSGDFFRVLGVPAIRGRVFTKDDDRHGGGTAGLVAVISYRFWKRNFGGDPGVIGKTIRLDRRNFEIVGVTEPWFTGLDADYVYDVAVPIGCEPILNTDASALNARSWWWLRLMGRIPSGETLKQAEARLRAIGPEVTRATLPQGWPPEDQKEYLRNSFSLSPAATGFSQTASEYRTALFTLMATVGLVLLIACANIANLLLARAAARQRELSVRMAIGASRRRVVRQLMTESLLIAVIGAVAGFLLSVLGSRVLVSLISTAGTSLEIDLTPDLAVFGFTAAVALLTAVLFGLAPALRGTRIGLNNALKESTRGTVRGSTRFHLGKALVAAQVALSLVLLVGAGLFLGTLRNLLTIDPGFSPQGILLVNTHLPESVVPKEQRLRLFRDALDRIRSVPGVAVAASSNMTPISHDFWNEFTSPEGYTPKAQADTLVYFNRVSPGYFRTMKIPLVMGRDFDVRDDLNAQPVMIISASAAKQFFGGTNPIGKTIRMERPGGRKVAYQVIGVVRDAKYGELNEATLRTGYLPCAQDEEPWPQMSYEVRSAGSVELLLPTIRSAVAGVNRDISLQFRSFETQVSDSLLRPRLVGLLSAVFGGLALLLAMVGLYGMTNYAVARRKSEIGIRMALGAQPLQVVWLMLRDVVALVAIGIAVGTGVALTLGKLVASLLYGTKPNDPLSLAGAALTLAAATALAAYLPARRAARLDPTSALREE